MSRQVACPTDFRASRTRGGARHKAPTPAAFSPMTTTKKTPTATPTTETLQTDVPRAIGLPLREGQTPEKVTSAHHPRIGGHELRPGDTAHLSPDLCPPAAPQRDHWPHHGADRGTVSGACEPVQVRDHAARLAGRGQQRARAGQQ